MRFIRLKGYYARGNARPVPAELSATVSGYGPGEQLTIECGQGRLILPYRPLEALCRELRQSGEAERSKSLVGADRAGKKQSVAVWLKKSGGFEMLTLECGDEQLSAPFAPIEQLVRAERRTQA